MNRITRTVASMFSLAVTAGVIVVGAPTAGAQTSNDNYASPSVLPSQLTGQVAGNNIGATLEAGEPSLGGTGRSSVHYSIIAPTTGPLRVTTAGSTYDTQLGIGTGDDATSLTLLAQNDDAAADTLQSEVTVDTIQGQTYRIVIDGYEGEQGDYNLSWDFTASSNDAFLTPTALPSDTTGQVTGNNHGASLEPGESRVADVGGSSVHYSIVAPVTGTLRLSTDGSDFDSVLGAGQGASADGLVLAAQNDDSAAGVLTSEVTLEVIEGETYRIVVGGYDGAQGNHTLAWIFTGGPVVDDPRPGDDQAEFLTLINEARSEARFCGGQHMPAVAPLATDQRLAASSQAHSNDMAMNNYFDHEGLNGSEFWERARDAGTTANTENIHRGPADVAAAVQGWLESPGHCRNIMTPDASRVGVGHASNPASDFTHYWTMMTGA